jgi:hypothetical protein
MNPAWGKTFRIRGARFMGRLSDRAGRSVEMILYLGGGGIPTELHRVTLDSDYKGDFGRDAMWDFRFGDATMSTLDFATEYFIAFAPNEADTNFELRTVVLPSAFDMTSLPGSAPFYLATRANDTLEFVADKTRRPLVNLYIEDWSKE